MHTFQYTVFNNLSTEYKNDYVSPSTYTKKELHCILQLDIDTKYALHVYNFML